MKTHSKNFGTLARLIAVLAIAISFSLTPGKAGAGISDNEKAILRVKITGTIHTEYNGKDQTYSLGNREEKYFTVTNEFGIGSFGDSMISTITARKPGSYQVTLKPEYEETFEVVYENNNGIVLYITANLTQKVDVYCQPSIGYTQSFDVNSYQPTYSNLLDPSDKSAIDARIAIAVPKNSQGYYPAGIYPVSLSPTSAYYGSNCFQIKAATFTVMPKESYSFVGTLPPGLSNPPASRFVPFDSKQPVQGAPASIEGWEFLGWTTSDAKVSSGAYTVSSASPVNEVRFTGSFKMKNQRTVTYVMDSKTLLQASYFPGDAILAPAIPSIDGYEFIAWKNLPAFMPDNDIVVEAEWRQIAYSLTFTVDGETVYSASVKPGEGIAPPEMPDREDCEFTGWGYVPDTMPPFDLAFEASYKRTVFTVTYMLDSQEYLVQRYRTGSLLPKLADPPHMAGYEFSGWDFSGFPAQMGEADLIVSGTFSQADGLAGRSGKAAAALNVVFCLMCFGCFGVSSAMMRSRGTRRTSSMLICLAPCLAAFGLLLATFSLSSPLHASDSYTPAFALMSMASVFACASLAKPKAGIRHREERRPRHNRHDNGDYAEATTQEIGYLNPSPTPTTDLL